MKFLYVSLLSAAFASMLYMSTGQLMVSALDLGEAKQEATANISTSQNLREITITDADLASGKAVMMGDRELRYDGKLYDIADRSIAGDKTILKVKWDEKEESLIGELCEHIENLFDNLPTQSKSAKHIVKSFGKDYFPCRYTIVSQIKSDQRDFVSIQNISDHTTVSIEINSPPPQA